MFNSYNPQQPRRPSLPPYTTPSASDTSLPSYNQVSAPPPGYTSLNPYSNQRPTSQYQFQQPRSFAPQGYMLPQQYGQPVFYAPSPLGQATGVQYCHPTFQPAQVQGQILNPYMGYQPQQQQQQFVTQPYSPFLQGYTMPMGYIPQGSQPQCQSSVLYRVVESDDEEEEEEEEEGEKEPKKGNRMPLRGVRYHIGGRK